jgi:hypothetical protein
MPFANYYIDDLYSAKYYWIKVANILPAFTKKVSRVHLNTGFVVNLNKVLTKVYLITEGQKNVIDTFTKEKALESHAKSIKNLNLYRELHDALEKIDFFNNVSTKEILENIITNCYFLEGKLRMIAYSNSPTIDDKNLIEFASHLSLGSLQA